MLEKSTITFNKDAHTYFTEDGKELISVTTLLKKHGIGKSFGSVPEEFVLTARERGNKIHADISHVINDFLNAGFKPNDRVFATELCPKLLPETKLFLQYLHENYPNSCGLDSEIIVGNDHVAGTIDLMVRNGNETAFIDFKTGKTIDTTYCSWQLSIYEYLACCKWSFDVKESSICVLHFHDDKMEVVEIPRVPTKEIERLIECDKRGEIYSPSPLSPVPYKEIHDLQAAHDKVMKLEMVLQDAVKDIVDELENAKAVKSLMMETLIEKMKENGMKGFESDTMKATYIAPFNKKSFDIKKFKEDNPQLAEQYMRATTVKESLRITFKDASLNEASGNATSVNDTKEIENGPLI